MGRSRRIAPSSSSLMRAFARRRQPRVHRLSYHSRAWAPGSFDTRPPEPAGFRAQQENPNRRCVELRAADINAGYLAANGVTPGVNAVAVAYLADKARRYAVNDTTVGDGLNTGGFRFNAKTPTSLNTYIARLDFKLTNRRTCSFAQTTRVTTSQLVRTSPIRRHLLIGFIPRVLRPDTHGRFLPPCLTR